MSVESIAAVLHGATDISPTAKLVLIGIANHDGDGGAWPSLRTLSKYANVTVRQVERHLYALEQLGYITRHVQEGGSRALPDHLRPNLYDLHVERLTGEPPVVDDAPSPVTDDGGTPVTDDAPEPSYETSDEQELPTVAAPLDVEVVAEAETLCVEMADAIEAWGAKRPTPGKEWCRDMDRMVRIDDRAPDDVRRVIRWLYGSNDEVAVFWAPNVQCPGKLRAKWDTIAGQVRRRRAQPEGVMDRIHAARLRMEAS